MHLFTYIGAKGLRREITQFSDTVKTNIILGLKDDVIEAFLTHCPLLNRMELSGQSLLTSGPFLPIISGKLFNCLSLRDRLNAIVHEIEKCDMILKRDSVYTISQTYYMYFVVEKI